MCKYCENTNAEKVDIMYTEKADPACKSEEYGKFYLLYENIAKE